MKKLIVGVPRALFYYRYFPFIKTFFEGVGAEVVVSSLTNKKILDEGISHLTEDVCFPVKVFCGHTISLSKKCDFIFIPSIYAVEKGVYNCAKFIGLPDLMRAAIKNIPSLLEPDINFDKGEKYVYREFKKTAQNFTSDSKKIKSAISKAKRAQEDFWNLMREELIPPGEAIDKMFFPSSKDGREDKKFSKTIAVIGHPYLLYDDYISRNFLNRLKKMGIRVLFPESVDKDSLRSFLLELVDSPYWTCEDEIIGSGVCFCQKKDVDGIISIGSFGCGPDSLMVELVRKYAKERDKPFLQIILDEHSAEAGVITRIEAFIDGPLQKRQIPLQKIKREDIKRNQTFSAKKQGRIRIIGIPNIGEKPSVWRKLARDKLGITLISPKITTKTVDLGVKYSPQDICFPYKVLLGNLIEALEEGADTLIMTASSNACRMGYYLRVMKKTLQDLGYKFRFLELKNTDKNIKGAIRILREFTNNTSFYKVFSFAKLGIIKLRILDETEKVVQKIRAVEIQKGMADKLYKESIEKLDKAMSIKELDKVRKEILKKLGKIPKEKNKDTLKMAVVGELFAVAEPFVNQEIEKELGSRGVEVERIKSAVFSEWTRLFHFNPLGEEKKKLEKFTKPYLKRDVGGHALESLGMKISLARKGYDGIIHLMPFGCLPEIIAQNIMIQTKEKIPVLTFALDEQLEKAGMITRIEAFLDVARNYHNAK